MHTLALLSILAGGLASPNATPLATHFDNAVTAQSWSFFNGAEFPGAKGSIDWDGSQGHEQPGCLALHYSFVGGGNYVQTTWSLPKENSVRSMRLWLMKPAGHRVTFRALDSGGQTFQKGTDYAYPGWQQIEVDLTRWDAHFGGANDGKIRFPIRQVGVLIENNAEPREGTLLIDDVELANSPAGPSSTLSSTYVAADFRGDQWRVGGGAGNSLQDGEWRYQFNDRQTPDLSTDYSLLGQPRALRLVLDGDGSGHSVHVQIGSHFQVFQHQAGTLSSKGEQVIKVPLGSMGTWQHHGGENDGQIRYPLRIQRIWLERGSQGPQSGAIRLKRLEVDIDFPADQAVLLKADVRSLDAGPQFSVDLRNLRSTPVKGKLICEYRDLSRRLGTEAIDLELPAAAKPVRREFLRPAGDSHLIEASFQWIDPAHTSTSMSIGASVPPEGAGSAAMEPESLAGCGVYLYRWHWNPQARENMTRVAELAQKAGVKWTREEFQWQAIEAEPGRFDFSFYDQVVDIARAHGVSVYGLLCYWSGWTKPNTQEGIDAYCRWVRQVVGHYKGKVKHWEIWNEPNIFFWTGPKEMYAKLLAQAYDAIKAEDPDAVVIGCSTSGIDTDFIKMVMAKGGKFDALSIHPYRGAMDDLRYIEDLKNVRKLVGGRDVWLTEIGFPSQLVTGCSERQQASLAARTYLASLASGAIRNVAWYDFRNDGNDPFDNEQNFGLVRNDLRPKPAYRTVATVCRTLAGMKVKEQIDIGSGAYAFRFSDGQRDVVAACAPEAGRLFSFQTDADVKIIDAVEQVVQPGRAGQDLPYPITLDSGFPVYIGGKTGFAFRPVKPSVSLKAQPDKVHPGDTITISLDPGQPVKEWDLPSGWPTPSKRSAGAYELRVPADAATGQAECQAIVGETSSVRLPFSIRVAPMVIRL